MQKLNIFLLDYSSSLKTIHYRWEKFSKLENIYYNNMLE